MLGHRSLIKNNTQTAVMNIINLRIIYKLYSLSDPPTLPRAVLYKLLEFATKRSHFLFDGQYYDQIDGEPIFSCVILRKDGS